MEIERKYLVNRELWEEVRSSVNPRLIKQAYLSKNPKSSVRIRISDNDATITIKGETRGISREEFEYPIPLADGLQMILLAEIPAIIKHRYEIVFNKYRWEVDEFHGDNEGLILAEVELGDEAEKPDWPQWIESEVTGEPRYFNLQLAINPINTW